MVDSEINAEIRISGGCFVDDTVASKAGAAAIPAAAAAKDAAVKPDQLALLGAATVWCLGEVAAKYSPKLPEWLLNWDVQVNGKSHHLRRAQLCWVSAWMCK